MKHLSDKRRETHLHKIHIFISFDQLLTKNNIDANDHQVPKGPSAHKVACTVGTARLHKHPKTYLAADDRPALRRGLKSLMVLTCITCTLLSSCISIAHARVCHTLPFAPWPVDTVLCSMQWETIFVLH